MVQHSDIDHAGVTGVTSGLVIIDESTTAGTATTLKIVGGAATVAVSGGTATYTDLGVVVQDDGAAVGTAVILNFTNGTATYSGGTATIDLASGGGTAGGATYTGQPVIVTPPVPFSAQTGGTNNSVGFGWATVINVPAPMKVRGLSILISTEGSGTIAWGLFDGSSTPATAVKITGGSAAPGGTGWRNIAATSAPVAINPGGYILIWKMPDANASTIATVVFPTAPFWNQIWTAYTWDDTPDLTSASWVSNTTAAVIALEGDLDASNTRWG